MSKKQNGPRMSFEFLDCMALALPAELLLHVDLLLPLPDLLPVAWWKSHAMELPKWANAFRLVLLVQPSSAAAEKVFSILQRFTAQQQSSMEDYLELSVMLQ